MELVRFATTCGVEVRDVDLREFDDDRSFRELEELFNAESILLFRKQDLGQGEGHHLMARFGELLEGKGVVTYKDPNGQGVLEFHSERSYQKEEPLRGLALHARQVPGEGGATLLFDCGAAFRALPDDLREELEHVNTIHRADPRLRLGDYYNELVRDLDVPEIPDGGWLATHPAISYHPVTGRPVLFMSPDYTIDELLSYETLLDTSGMSDERGDLLRSRLRAHLKNPDFVYRHQWSEGDFVLWDNFVVMHSREAFDHSIPRVLWKYEFKPREGVTHPEPHVQAMKAEAR